MLKMYEIKEQKAQIRDIYKEKRKNLSEQQRQTRDSALCAAFTATVSYSYYDTLLLYSPAHGEIDITAIALCALRDGKRIAYPRCFPDSNPQGSIMDFYFVTSPEELVPGMFGISQPPEGAQRVIHTPGDCSACLIPGIVYDKHGYRLGYGRGYYDRYLSSYPGMLVGIVYNDFILDSLPHGKYDIHADVLITEGGVRPVVKI